MKSKLIYLLLLFFPVFALCQVPDTETFTLQDVVNAVNPTTDDLTDCFNDANSAYFNATHKASYYAAAGNKNNLLMFRDYGSHNASGSVICTGGTVTDINVGGVDYRVHTFISSGTLTVTTSGAIEYLVVAGGGGVSNDNRAIGGGGGGGVLQGSLQISSGNYSITIGAGGLGAYRPTSTTGGTPAESKGEDSSIGTLVIVDGGGTDGYNPALKNGGSGGGGSVYSVGVNTGGAGIPGQGYDGGVGAETRRAGGGGGAGEPGTTKSTNGYGGDGGDGIQSSINGTATYYGGGGGGAGWNGTAAIGHGGLGGGAVGGYGYATSAQNGQANAGGGAGGTNRATAVGQGDTNGRTGSGGSGIVIIRYQL